MRPIDLHKPDHAPDLRASVVIKPGPLADFIRGIAERAQIEPAAVLRLLADEAKTNREKLEKAG